ncbi:cell division protein FtsL [Pseudokordiimonas caeni]|uniref:cell division protein FtsL n=1 Tax=Pseudokordiimonas caeni TaxID=2997908 RepID=UPI002810DF28|nr:hypothetical protein [Pseudokordiimonas caeni]
MRRAFNIVAAVIALTSGAAVLQLKLTVQAKQDELNVLARQIHDDRDALRVLEAEWAYLTSPASLQERSVRFLALMPPSADQIITDPRIIPFRPKGEFAEADPGVMLERKRLPKRPAGDGQPHGEETSGLDVISDTVAGGGR